MLKRMLLLHIQTDGNVFIYVYLALSNEIFTCTDVTFTYIQILALMSYLLQGDPNQNLLFQLALSLNVGIPDPMLVKPKCV